MKKHTNRFLILFLLGTLASCNLKIPPITQWFPTTPREFYERDLRRKKLDRTPAGRAWQRQAEQVLSDSLLVGLPYREKDFFGDSVSAHSYRFVVPAGRRLVISTDPTGNDSTLRLFADLFRVSQTGKPERVAYMAKDDSVIVYGGGQEETLLLRLQTGLNNVASITLNLKTEPVLGFPVASRSRADIISYWGAVRDAGRRSHEGIDIRAPRGTPVVAAANGFVSRVGTNNLGGNVVSVSATGLGISLYYAHLDTQLVTVGQRVKRGDTLGTVGNTGNAITTAPHLHFGIYGGWSGARDPLPFVNDREERLPNLAATRWLGDTARLAQKGNLFRSYDLKEKIAPLNKHAVVWITGQSARSYRVLLPDGTKGYIATTSLQPIEGQLTKRKVSTPLPLINLPVGGAETVRSLTGNETVEVLGYFEDYELVRTEDGATGWLSSTSPAR
ncbi:M23 family metallopeptidase [Telluribacter sp.]|jgi:murein DD-endopeptidase MepM/ murein hydrolase activator NlpD|uniref:M23 family metallopeptidase n=1 Tax=Telluribacter sp. TaxID=1978767 RepID=UPI002E0DFB44|nr:M23 family metallopeptidase [Telluribacter sp.]